VRMGAPDEGTTVLECLRGKDFPGIKTRKKDLHAMGSDTCEIPFA
jgi:hypothetical protein